MRPPARSKKCLLWLLLGAAIGLPAEAGRAAGSPEDALPEPTRKLLLNLSQALNERAQAAGAKARAEHLAALGVEQLEAGLVEEARLRLEAAREAIWNLPTSLQLAPPHALIDLQGRIFLIQQTRESAAVPGPSWLAAEASRVQFAEKPPGAWLRTGLKRLDPYRTYLKEVFRNEGVPPDLIYLSLVESAFDPAALSTAGAGGVWQLMPATARRYGLRVDSLLDERLQLDKATLAAARYLKDLHRLFGDWTLALAAYNAGEGRIQKALQQSQDSDFWDLRARNLLPPETAGYVPLVLKAASWARNTGRE